MIIKVAKSDKKNNNKSIKMKNGYKSRTKITTLLLFYCPPSLGNEP